MRVLGLTLLACLGACGLVPSGGHIVEPDSSGHMTMSGDESADTALEGIGVSHFMGQTVCLLRLYDDSNLPDSNAHFGIQLGIGTGGLPAYATGETAQGPGANPGASFRVYTGVKNTERVYSTTSGSVTITRFDAARLVGSFSLTAERACQDRGKPTCVSTATGSFDAKNEDCFPPLVP